MSLSVLLTICMQDCKLVWYVRRESLTNKEIKSSLYLISFFINFKSIRSLQRRLQFDLYNQVAMKLLIFTFSVLTLFRHHTTFITIIIRSVFSTARNNLLCIRSPQLEANYDFEWGFEVIVCFQLRTLNSKSEDSWLFRWRSSSLYGCCTWNLRFVARVK